MPGLPEDTASLAEKVYHRVQVLRSIQWLLRCRIRRWGVPKGSRGNTSSGIRGGEDEIKATRTLWLVAQGIYNRHAMSPIVKNPSKTD